MTHHSVIMASPLGELLLVANENALSNIMFTSETPFEDFESSPNAITEQAEIQLTEYFAGIRKSFEIPLETEGTIFQRSCWEALREIKYGQTISYKDEARQVWNVKAVRAVAQANKRNPLPIIIPCHRVVQNDGKIGGYGGGVDKKEWLLNHEENNYNQK